MSHKKKTRPAPAVVSARKLAIIRERARTMILRGTKPDARMIADAHRLGQG